MIKQIQLRGISRTPSDRATEDGGLAESLNVILDSNECAPVLEPKLMNESLGLPEDLQAKRIFIHKVGSILNTIVFHKGTIFSYVQGEKTEVVMLDEDEKVKDFTSIGNTLIVATSKRICYILYKGGIYKFLGSGVPRPCVRFETISNLYPDEVSFHYMLQGKTDSSATSLAYIQSFNISVWKNAIADKKNNILNGAVQQLDALHNALWDKIRTKIDSVNKDKKREAPFFVRYALRMFDDTYSYISEPILIGAGFKDYLHIEGTKYVSQTNGTSTNIAYQLSNVIQSTARLDEFDFTGYEEIIKSLDIFVSEPLYVPRINALFADIKQTSSIETGPLSTYKYDITFESEDIEKELLAKSNFFLIKSFNLNELSVLSEGYNLMDDYNLLSPDKLVEQEQLIDTARNWDVVASQLFSYNNALLADVEERRFFDIQQINSSNIALKSTPSDYSYGDLAFAFYVETEGGLNKKVSKKDGSYLYKNYELKVPDDQGQSLTEAKMYGLVFYPDVRCVKMEIWCGTDVFTVGMKRHPYLPYSYAYWGLDKSIDSLRSTYDVQLEDFIANSKDTEEISNKLYVSEMNNPFVFSDKGIFTFQSKVLGVAVATTALSQGQFGQFPLYVFTEDGIWAMETAADGSFVTSKPLSREVCINPDSITSIDNAVVFVSSKGVMMISGSQVVNLSPNMNGKHYSLDEKSQGVLEGEEFGHLNETLADEDPFMKFMAAASCAYDYAGQRLIFIKEGEEYQYVYKIDTQTWHKTAYAEQLTAPLNSYPECLVQGFLTIDNPDAANIYIECEHPMESVTENEIDNVFQSMSTISKNMLALTEPNISEKDNYAKFLTGEISRVKVKGDESLADSIIDEINYWWGHENVSCGYAYIPPEISVSRVYDLSTILDVADPQPALKGCIITRPIDLGEVDIKKTIKDIRIRGQYEKGHVRFILQGSDDGFNWSILNSLRGKSWKLFRMIILTDLQPHERISWIDIEYETRFKNRLR